jgi:hypothetical protein
MLDFRFFFGLPGVFLWLFLLPQRKGMSKEVYHVFGRDDVSHVLFADFVARKYEEWRLVTLEEVSRLHRRLKAVTSRHDMNVFDLNNLLFIPSPCDLAPSIFSALEVVAVVQQEFPMAQVLLDAFSGHLVLAGGALCSVVLLGKINRHVSCQALLRRGRSSSRGEG